MGPEIVLIIALCAGGMSLISGGTSVLSFYHAKKVSKNVSKDTTHVIITEKISDGVKTKEKIVDLKTTDFDSSILSSDTMETGRPNEVANTLASGAAYALKAISGCTISGNTEVQKTLHTSVEVTPPENSDLPRIHCTSDSIIEASKNNQMPDETNNSNSTSSALHHTELEIAAANDSNNLPARPTYNLMIEELVKESNSKNLNAENTNQELNILAEGGVEMVDTSNNPAETTLPEESDQSSTQNTFSPITPDDSIYRDASTPDIEELHEITKIGNNDGFYSFNEYSYELD
ncbi:MAG: hypothetical protein P8P83_02000 [Rickettsiaceae bacterium]|nr:hypothetical protein [Rickettsiaceae bacterium]